MNLNYTQYIFFSNLQINYTLKTFYFFFYFFPQQIHQFKVDTKSALMFNVIILNLNIPSILLYLNLQAIE